MREKFFFIPMFLLCSSYLMMGLMNLPIIFKNVEKVNKIEKMIEKLFEMDLFNLQTIIFFLLNALQISFFLGFYFALKSILISFFFSFFFEYSCITLNMHFLFGDYQFSDLMGIKITKDSKI